MFTYDLVIIGGGTVGTACFLDASSRGLKVALVEKGKVGMQTNSSSLGLVQGGAKYMAQDLDLVRMDSIDAGLMTRIAGGFLSRIKMILPVFQNSRFPLWFWDGYFDAYDRTASSRNCAEHKILSTLQLANIEPGIKGDVVGAVTFHEWLANPLELSRAMAEYGKKMGGIIFENSTVCGSYCQVDESGTNQKTIRAVIVKSWGEEITIRGSYFLNAGGPWASKILDTLRISRFKTRPTRGTSIIVNKQLVKNGVILFDKDGKYVTVMPYGDGQTLIGPTNHDVKEEVAGNPDLLIVPEWEKDDLLSLVNHNFKTQVLYEDIVRVKCGLRPQLDHHNVKPDDITHQFVLIDHQERDGIANCCTIFGGKLSVQLRMAKEAVDLVCSKLCSSGKPVSRSWVIPKIIISRSGRLRINTNHDFQVARFYGEKRALSFRDKIGRVAMAKKIKARFVLLWFICRSFFRHYFGGNQC